MICPECKTEYEGNFCHNCGAASPQKAVCYSCGAVFEGSFCNNCGARYIEPIETRCRRIIDKNGNTVDVDRLAGVYLSAGELRAYFRKCTNYSNEEINELAAYIDENIDGNDYGFLEGFAEKMKIEADAMALSPAQQYESQRPLTKRERIRENKRNAIACCPKCGSTSLSANKKGFGIVKGGLGALAGGLTCGVGAVVGLGAGNINAKKVWVTCLNCKHRWLV